MATVLSSTSDLEHRQWLEMRRKGIGGSDVAAIAGLNRWKSPIAVWLEKTGQANEEDTGEAAYWGTVLEDVVAREFSQRTGMKVKRRNAILQHPEHPWMLANVDRLIVGKKAGLECKTASEYLKDEWKDDEVPAQYILQCQHYMAVTGYQEWWISVLIGGNKFIYKKIERDNELIGHIIEIEKNFWENHVLTKIPPDFDGSDASTDLLKTMYPDAEPDSEVELPDEAETIIEALEQVKKEMQELDDQKKEYENKLKAMLGENERGIAGEHVVTWKPIISRRFDNKSFKKDHPDFYEKYAKESSYRRFSIS